MATLCLACASAPPAPNLLAGHPPASPATARPPRLEKGVPQKREIRGGETHEYRIAARAGDYARVTVDQAGIDVAVRLAGPSGEEIAAADGIGGRMEPELLSWIAGAEGDFLLGLTAREPGPGSYEVSLEELRPSVAGDLDRVAAEKLMYESDHLRARGDAEMKRKALAKLEDALDLWKSAGDRRQQVTTLNQLAALHRTLGDSAKALTLCEAALALAMEIGDRRGEAAARNNLGVAHHQLGEYEQAVKDLQQALALWEEMESPNDIASTVYSLGVVQFARGLPEEALASWQRALEIRRERGDLNTQALILTGIASVYRDKGEGDKALELLAQALELSRSIGDRSSEANVLQIMASIYLRRGELQKALEVYTSVLDLHHLLGNRSMEALVLTNLGATSLYLGEADHALGFYTRAHELYRQMGSSAMEPYTLRDIGWVQQVRGEPQVALDYYIRAYELSRSWGDRRCEGLTLHGIGRAKIALGSPGEAVQHLEQAIELYRETGETVGEINALLDLGRAYQAVSDQVKAGEYFRSALALSRQRNTLMTEAIAQSAVARLERDLGHFPEAAAAIEEALRIIESIRPKVASQRQRVSFFASRREYYEFYVDLQMQMHERDREGGHLAAALAASERARARALLDLLAEGLAEVRRGISPELKQREEEAGNRISLLQSQLLEDLSQGGKRASQIEAELGHAEEDRERIEWQIQREHPRYAAVRKPAPLRLEKIQELLDDSTAFLEYAVGQDVSYLFVVTRDRLEGYRLPPASELAEEVEAIHGALQEPGRRFFSRYAAAAHRLYEILIAPAEAVLRDKPRLIVSPDGPLLLLTYETLLTSAAGQGRRYRDLPYLIREKSVTYVPSASVFAELGGGQAAVPAASGPGLFLGFADPAYGALAQGSPSSGSAASGPLARAFERAGLPSPRRLPDSRREVEGIAGLYPPDQVRLYLDGEASEENVKENPGLKTARRIHFAVHGFLSEGHPELSGLVLAFDDDPQEDGLLQVYEIFNLDLQADLVVLSACETALGKNVSGEGLLGVSRAFLYAGAASVVVSLWRVADASTFDLMVRFYRHMNEGADKAEALRLSKLEMIEEGPDNPYYWAPFILIGQPGSVVTSRRAARQ